MINIKISPPCQNTLIYMICPVFYCILITRKGSNVYSIFEHGIPPAQGGREMGLNVYL